MAAPQRVSSRTTRKCAALSKIIVKQELRARSKQVSQILKKPEDERHDEEKLILQQSPEIVISAIRRAKSRALSKERLQETEDAPEILQEKCQQLAKAIQEARYFIIFTGAGISTAASIPDYRGPNGVWTLLEKGIQPKVQDLSDAEPTLTHMAITQIYREGYVKHVVSQNCDGLHLRSGLPQHVLSEVHGNMYLEVCHSCKPQREYLRLFDVTERTGVRRHKTGRKCHECGDELRDTIVHFGEKGGLKIPYNWQQAVDAVDRADVILCLGSSLKVLRKYGCLWSMHKPIAKRAKLFIVNLQWTPKDDTAKLKINGRCDDVMRMVLEELKHEIPSYTRERDPLFEYAIPLRASEGKTTCKKILIPPAHRLWQPIDYHTLLNKKKKCKRRKLQVVNHQRNKLGIPNRKPRIDSKTIKLSNRTSKVKQRTKSVYDGNLWNSDFGLIEELSTDCKSPSIMASLEEKPRITEKQEQSTDEMEAAKPTDCKPIMVEAGQTEVKTEGEVLIAKLEEGDDSYKDVKVDADSNPTYPVTSVQSVLGGGADAGNAMVTTSSSAFNTSIASASALPVLSTSDVSQIATHSGNMDTMVDGANSNVQSPSVSACQNPIDTSAILTMFLSEKLHTDLSQLSALELEIAQYLISPPTSTIHLAELSAKLINWYSLMNVTASILHSGTSSSGLPSATPQPPASALPGITSNSSLYSLSHAPYGELSTETTTPSINQTADVPTQQPFRNSLEKGALPAYEHVVAQPLVQGVDTSVAQSVMPPHGQNQCPISGISNNMVVPTVAPSDVSVNSFASSSGMIQQAVVVHPVGHEQNVSQPSGPSPQLAAPPVHYQPTEMQLRVSAPITQQSTVQPSAPHIFQPTAPLTHIASAPQALPVVSPVSTTGVVHSTNDHLPTHVSSTPSAVSSIQTSFHTPQPVIQPQSSPAPASDKACIRPGKTIVDSSFADDTASPSVKHPSIASVLTEPLHVAYQDHTYALSRVKLEIQLHDYMHSSKTVGEAKPINHKPMAKPVIRAETSSLSDRKSILEPHPVNPIKEMLSTPPVLYPSVAVPSSSCNVTVSKVSGTSAKNDKPSIKKPSIDEVIMGVFGAMTNSSPITAPTESPARKRPAPKSKKNKSLAASAPSSHPSAFARDIRLGSMASIDKAIENQQVATSSAVSQLGGEQHSGGAISGQQTLAIMTPGPAQVSPMYMQQSVSIASSLATYPISESLLISHSASGHSTAAASSTGACDETAMSNINMETTQLDMVSALLQYSEILAQYQDPSLVPASISQPCTSLSDAGPHGSPYTPVNIPPPATSNTPDINLSTPLQVKTGAGTVISSGSVTNIFPSPKKTRSSISKMPMTDFVPPVMTTSYTCSTQPPDVPSAIPSVLPNTRISSSGDIVKNTPNKVCNQPLDVFPSKSFLHSRLSALGSGEGMPTVMQTVMRSLDSPTRHDRNVSSASNSTQQSTSVMCVKLSQNKEQYMDVNATLPQSSSHLAAAVRVQSVITTTSFRSPAQNNHMMTQMNLSTVPDAVQCVSSAVGKQFQQKMSTVVTPTSHANDSILTTTTSGPVTQVLSQLNLNMNSSIEQGLSAPKKDCMSANHLQEIRVCSIAESPNGSSTDTADESSHEDEGKVVSEKPIESSQQSNDSKIATAPGWFGKGLNLRRNKKKRLK